MSEVLEVRADDRGVVRIALNRPDVRNAFNAELIEALTRAVTDLPEDARVVVIEGKGKVFCAGADLDWMRSMASFSREENIEDSNALSNMLVAIDSCAVPVVGKVHGAAVAGATGLVSCCDVAVAARSTFFAFTEVRLGLVPAVISPYVLRRVGYGFARYAFLTAERFDSERAFEVGLVDKVVDDEDLESEVEAVIGSLLAGGPAALAETRKLLDNINGKSPSEVAELTVKTIAERRASDEGQEGIASFFEKRSPRWVR